MSKKNNVLVIAAHPDDEILGCGATMARHIADGDHVEVIIMAEGVTSRARSRDANAAKHDLEALKATARQAHACLGVKKIHFLDLPDNRLDSVVLIDMVKRLEDYVRTVKSNIIYTHFPSDLNIDHQRTAQAVLTACRPQPGASVNYILFFEVPSSTEWFPGGPLQNGYFHPNHFVSIGKNLKTKMKALDVYQSEMRDFPHARSLEAVQHLARWRGASVGVEAAEAFQIARSLR